MIDQGGGDRTRASIRAMLCAKRRKLRANERVKTASPRTNRASTPPLPLKTMITLDRTDFQLLAALQRDGRATNPALGERIHLSASQVSRRIQRLEDAGLIDRYVTLLRPVRLGLTVIAYTRVSLERHGEAQNEDFNRAVQLLPEVLE